MIVVVADGDSGPVRERLIAELEVTIDCQAHTLIDPIGRLNPEVGTPFRQQRRVAAHARTW